MVRKAIAAAPMNAVSSGSAQILASVERSCRVKRRSITNEKMGKQKHGEDEHYGG